MNKDDETAIHIHLLQYRSTVFIQRTALILGVIGAIKYGFASILAGLIGAWVFHLLKPGPIERLDRATERNKPG